MVPLDKRIGIGSLALKLHVMHYHFCPSTCCPLPKVGKNLLPEVFDAVIGGGEPTSSTIKKAVKRAAGKTIKKQLGTGAAKKKRRQSVGKNSRTKNSRTAKKGRKKSHQAKQKRLKNAKRFTFFKTCLDGQ